MTTLPFPGFVRARDAYSFAADKPNKNSPVRKLSQVELATVQITLVEPPQPLNNVSYDLCTVLACRLHSWPDKQVRSFRRGWKCAEQFATICSPFEHKPLIVWRGWDLLRQLDLRDELGVQVWLQTNSMTSPSYPPHDAPSFVRLKDRLAHSANANGRLDRS